MDVDFREGIPEPSIDPSHDDTKENHGENDIDVSRDSNNNRSSPNKNKGDKKDLVLNDEGNNSDMEDIVDYMDTRQRGNNDEGNFSTNKTQTNKKAATVSITPRKTPIRKEANGNANLKKGKATKKNNSVDNGHSDAFGHISPINGQDKKKPIMQSRNRPQSSIGASNNGNYATSNINDRQVMPYQDKKKNFSTMATGNEKNNRTTINKLKSIEDQTFNKTIDYFENPDCEGKPNNKKTMATQPIPKTKPVKKNSVNSSTSNNKKDKVLLSSNKKTTTNAKINRSMEHYEIEKSSKDKGKGNMPQKKIMDIISNQVEKTLFEKNQEWDRKRKEKIEAQKKEKMKDVMKYNKDKPTINKSSVRMVNKSMDHGNDDYSTVNRLYKSGAKIKEARKLLEEKYAPSFKPKLNKKNPVNMYGKRTTVTTIESMDRTSDIDRDSMHDLIRNKVLKRVRNNSME